MYLVATGPPTSVSTGITKRDIIPSAKLVIHRPNRLASTIARLMPSPISIARPVERRGGSDCTQAVIRQAMT